VNSFRTPMTAAALAAAAAFLPGFIALAPNRLASGAPVGLVQCAPLAAAVIAVAILSLAVSAWRGQAILGLAAGIVLLLATPLAAGTGAAALLRHAGPAARAELACGFWLLGAAAVLAIMTASAALRVKPSWRAALLAALAAALLLVVASGALNALSLAREYQSHRAAFRAAALRHLLLVGMTLAGALAAGMPLGLTAWRHKAWRPAIFAALNIIQTLPSIALFGLLMVPLARLGLSGIGLVPAVIALVLYALLPTVRAIVSGLENVPAAPLQAAGGVGFGRWQEFWHVRPPRPCWRACASSWCRRWAWRWWRR
jgi:osmoprotectant transport system permease protein